MIVFADRAGLQVAAELAGFLETRVLPGLAIAPETFWPGFAAILTGMTPRNRELLAKRDALQTQIDAWHAEHPGTPDTGAYQSFLREIGYLVPEPEPFAITPDKVDDEVARLAGAQLVVPVLNARFLLNAANARWGSLYDALYGTDALGDLPSGAGFDAARAQRVIAYAANFLDQTFPLRGVSWAGVMSAEVYEGRLLIDGAPLVQPSAFAGIRGEFAGILLKHNGLHVELRLDQGDSRGYGLIQDILVESALTTIVDMEDSVAAVDAADKVAAYANWLGLMQGDLTASFHKGGKSLTRRLAEDRAYSAPGGARLTLPGRSLLFVRNVGHLMTTPAIRLPDGSEAFEGQVDAVITSLIGLYDLRRLSRLTNSRAGSIYIAKPKMHGPDEAAFSNALFDAVEDLLGLERHTVKLGLMDEERRTSANLAACIREVAGRLVFINTGFLDRTGDEIHTSIQAGAMVRKNEMRSSAWIAAYEARNVQIGLACGLSGRAQIGKGMWAAPDRMADMLSQKIGHPKSGATTAWVPSPTAATLHALHYHQVDVFARQKELTGAPVPPLDALLTLPLAGGRNWTADEVREELDNNAQGILGYVARWIDQGVGCSKVPDIHDVGLMEDRATLRISSQHLANWLLHGVATREQVEDAFRRMAVKVDAQNAGDPAYRPMSGYEADSLAFQAAQALVFEGLTQPNGYTEPLLHAYRARAKAALA